MAQESMSEEAANCALGRLMARGRTFQSAEMKANWPGKQPKWRGPVGIKDVDETGVTTFFQRQTLKVAKDCAHKRQDPVELRDARCLDAVFRV